FIRSSKTWRKACHSPADPSARADCNVPGAVRRSQLESQRPFVEIRQVVLDQHDIMPAEVLVEPLPRLCKPAAGHNLALGCGGLERIGERLDALRRDRDQHIDMLGGEATDLLMLLLMRR